MTAPLLELRDVQARVGRYHILRGATLSVPRAGTTALLGRNGAGKTTTLRVVMGFWRAFAGRILLDGRDIAGLPTPEIARLGLGYSPEDMGIFAGLTVRENLLVAVREGTPDAARLDWIFTLFPALKKFWRLPAGALSGGQKQMLAVARAIVEPRRLLLVDEPTKGLAPSVVDAMAPAFRDIGRETPILLVEQNFQFARRVADSATVMDDGRVVHAGPMEKFARDTESRRRLLGLDLVPASGGRP